MKRAFGSKEAKDLIKAHKAWREKIVSVKAEEPKLLGEISSAAEALEAVEADRILSETPIDEINRSGKSFRIKTLRDGGFNTVADLNKATLTSLSAINGISDDGARQIKQVVNEIVKTTKQNVKIRLSSDNKTPESTRLIKAVSKYKSVRKLINECTNLDSEHGARVDKAISSLTHGTNAVKWFFTPEHRKNKAEEAYTYLNGLSAGEYGITASGIISELDKSSRLSDEEAWQDFADNSVTFFNILEEICPDSIGTTDTMYGLPEELALAIQEQPINTEGLRCELRRYQEWGVKYILHQGRVLLGDEMGLGKTIQAIASMVSLRNDGATHFMVVCPASVVTNWCREVTKMSDLSVIKIHGSDRDSAFVDWVKKGGVGVTTFETTGRFEIPEDLTLTMLVTDEAHYIKNPSAQRTKNVKKICAKAVRLLFMTGTALENNVKEMITLMDILQPVVANSVQGMEFLSSAPEFREKVSPVYYRRRREDVLTELPELTETQEWCDLLPEEKKIYEQAVLEHHFANARRVSWSVGDMKKSSKAIRLMEIVEEAKAENRKIIVFSFFLDTIKKVTDMLGEQCLAPINGSVSPQRRQEIIDEFNAAPAGAVLAAQIQSGGTGLNIQCASVVILCEPQFKPSIENQAISRAYRMGQTRNVLVYRLLCDDTVDERITEILATKQALFDAFADTSEVADKSFELDEKTFAGIMKQEEDRINGVGTASDYANRGSAAPMPASENAENTDTENTAEESTASESEASPEENKEESNGQQ